MDDTGHQVDEGEFLGDVARLYAWLSARDAAILRSSGREDQDPGLDRLRDVVSARQEREIARLILSIAVTLRVKFDDGAWQDPGGRFVGWMSNGDAVDPERGISLSLREVCNKLIHAKRVDPERHAGEGGQRFIGSVWTLGGAKGGERWTLELYVLQFAIAAANVKFGGP